MSTLLSNEILMYGLKGFAKRLRSGETTALHVTESCLTRIEALNPKLDAFVHIASEQALETARAIDSLLAAGVDLGPLMGVPVAVKDIIAVQGMPTRAGSCIDIADLIGQEGRFIKTLKSKGCIILGKTRTIEFAAGGQNTTHPTPWNPCDLDVHLTPGGSSSGSAVAMAAGLCGLALGSDTGGSVRAPAALCGVFGLKTTWGLWPLDGIFPLCPSMDSIGLLSATATDAACFFSALDSSESLKIPDIRGLRFGVPENHFFDDLDPMVQKTVENALQQIQDKGAILIPIDLPEAPEVKDIFAKMVSSDLLASIGEERYLRERENIDPVAVGRLDMARETKAAEYITLARRYEELGELGTKRLHGLDGFLCPTTPLLPQPLSQCLTPETAGAFTARSLHNTRPGNAYNLCAATLPLQSGSLPVGLQVHCSPGKERRLLEICMAFEKILDRPQTCSF
ncbi:amidase [Desulfonatronovibrio magnus]|uniref:amidase n=1 Tax=Desulfonatronovibrio magnus TaxID=698827 RepID=UPI0005EB7897|nr:amidase [Desulfonatronovibrio magnus]